MIGLLGMLMGVAFVAAQGGAVFISAWLAKKLLGLESSWWKPLLMLVSYLAWIILTGTVYSMLGGGGGLMEGGMLILFLFSTAALSSAIYAFLWLLVPLVKGQTANG